MKRQTSTPFNGGALRSGGAPVRTLLCALAVFTLLAAAGPSFALAAPSATTDPAIKVHHTSAVLTGHLNPDADPGIVDCHFEWGETVSYGNTAPCNEGNAFAAPADVTANLNNLTPGTTYHYRLDIETTSSGPFKGADRIVRPNTFPITHPEIASFGPDGTSGSTFNELFGIAFNQTTRQLFTLDRRTTDIYGFDVSNPPTYAPLPSFDPLNVPGVPDEGFLGDQPDVAVDNTALSSAGNIYYVSDNPGLENNVYGYDSSGTPLPGFPVKTTTGAACGAAVDSAGNLWLANRNLKMIEKFSPAGTKLSLINVPQESACKLAFDTNDDMYVATHGGRSVWKYTAASGYTSGSVFATAPIGGEENSNVAVDPTTHNVYLSHSDYGGVPSGSWIQEYDSGGRLIGESGFFNAAGHVTVDGTNHHVFLGSRSDDKIHVFDTTQSTTVKLPTVTTGQASSVTGSSATLNGAVDPEGMPVTNCHIAWGAGADPEQNVTPCSPSPGSGSGDVAVSAEITGLAAGSEYFFRVFASNTEGTKAGVRRLFITKPKPTVSASPVTNATSESADLNGLVNPKGFPTTYRFEWGLTTAYGNSVPVPDGSAGSGEGNVAVSGHLSGLVPNTRYHWRLVAEGTNGSAATEDGYFFTLGAPLVETTGAPVRTTNSAQLGARVTPNGTSTSYLFEYGDQGPCDANPCTQTEPQPAGSGEFTELVSEEVKGLQPETTYHYRVVADNGQPGGSVAGGDMTVITRGTEAPPTRGHFPGPPRSDRAWELVSSPESGGNPVEDKYTISDDGTRAVWGLGGGAPFTEVGGFNMLFSERTPHGWQTKKVQPPRDQLVASSWKLGMSTSDLSSFVAVNYGSAVPLALIRMGANSPPEKLFQVPDELNSGGFFPMSEDGSRVLMAVDVNADPDYPNLTGRQNIYDVTTAGEPHMISLLPDGTMPACGVPVFFSGTPSPYLIQGSNFIENHWITPDGDRAFFISSGNNCSVSPRLYMRNIDAQETKLLSGPVLSGPECGANFIKSTSEAAFFWTQSRLVAADTEPAACTKEGSVDLADGDVYRYDLDDGSLECVTCVVSGVDADVLVLKEPPMQAIAISGDGARIYFRSNSRLLPGVEPGGLYRVNTETDDLAYVGFIGAPASIALRGNLNPDGLTLTFESNEPSLNPLGGGAGNAGTNQIYRYSDVDRSLICVSCPQDGSAPRGGAVVPTTIGQGGEIAFDNVNVKTLSASGIIAFGTPSPLVGADQNTPPAGHDPVGGTDVYEWRDGQPILVSDGLTDWPGPGSAPRLKGITPSGHDIIFTAATQYTPDALDNYQRLYDARIGGGIEFPKPPPPCPLEVCQGIPKGPPEERAPGTNFFAGPGNAKTEAKKKRKARKHHHKKAKKHAKNRANQDRRTAR